MVAEIFALAVNVSATIKIRLLELVVVIAPLTETLPPRMVMSPAIVLAAVKLIVAEFEGLPTSSKVAEVETEKLLPISKVDANEVFAGITLAGPEELKLKYAAVFQTMVSTSNSAPPPAVLL